MSINNSFKERYEQKQREQQERANKRFPLLPFDQLKPGTETAYLVRGLIPRHGLTVAWGPPKCGKSFKVFDISLHCALGWPYRGRPVITGPVVYCAFEGASGFHNRAEAFRHHHHLDANAAVPFYLQPLRMDLVKDHAALIASIQEKSLAPVLVILDTLNRSLVGSESSDEDMMNYLNAADAIIETFDCAGVIVHHCGVDGTRPRGHTSLTGTVVAQLAIKRDHARNTTLEVEHMKDGPEGDLIASRLESVNLGETADGEPITSCVVVPVESYKRGSNEPRLTPNQKTMFSMVHSAGGAGLTTEQWNEKAKEVGIGTGRPATLYDIRSALKGRGLVCESGGVWRVKQPGVDELPLTRAWWEEAKRKSP